MRFPCKENRKKGLLVKPCVYLCVKDSLSHAEYFISRRAAENAKLASRFALAVGLAECWRSSDARVIATRKVVSL